MTELGPNVVLLMIKKKSTFHAFESQASETVKNTIVIKKMIVFYPKSLPPSLSSLSFVSEM